MVEFATWQQQKYTGKIYKPEVIYAIEMINHVFWWDEERRQGNDN